MKDHRKFDNPALGSATPLTIDGDRVYGHVAEWGPFTPRTTDGYRRFRRGRVTTTTGQIRTGALTIGTEHAGDRLSALAAAEHYDTTGSAVADVMVGEDDHGIWYSGQLRPDVSPSELAGCAVSGDWRWITDHYEMVGALVVRVVDS